MFMLINIFDRIGLRLLQSRYSSCSVGNGSKLSCVGECQVPFMLEGVTRVINVIVVDETLNVFVLGVDFFQKMCVVLEEQLVF